MGYVPLGLQLAMKNQKYAIYRLLLEIGITRTDAQIEFMSKLLNKELNVSKMSKQDAMSLLMKLNQIKAEKDKS
jgi:hypothetical protein